MQPGRYPCLNLDCSTMPAMDSDIWKDVPLVSLVDVVSGQLPELETSFQLFRDDKAGFFYLRFFGQDDELHSSFTMHDAPIYRQDVVELFVADASTLSTYREMQVSPYDIHFDGIIEYDGEGKRSLNMSWDIEGWKSRSRFDADARQMSSVWALPYSAFTQPPRAGESWRFNAFRIDHSGRGISHQAWQKTGAVNFHVPDCFGYLDFQP